ncbi:Xaa-Pro aminopeptidase [Aestuariibacter salexigens]|uniref:Xaa-Pro aminopeptidase n=1 Tax=Aestuariibacter salexigens TaxID=226010 RepID=UPI000479CFF2|nr:Xaa-Pro aminopeptidase [Aestuariibacter salexigens]
MLPQQEFILRRHAFLDAMQPDSIALIPAAQLVTRSNDTEFPFRQDSDFYYLTGFPEPDAWLILSNHQRYHSRHSALLCLDKNPLAEIWHGRRIGPEQAKIDYGMDATFARDELNDVLEDYLDGHQHVYFAQGHNALADSEVQDAMESLRSAPKQTKAAPTTMIDLRPLVHEMRLFKSAAELAVMQKAADISCAAHVRAMKFASPGCYEYQLEAELHHEFAMHGARYPAYGTIVGSGDNACILHYTENSQVCQDGDLILIDSGAEYIGYAADITRTFPVNGRFSDTQATLYQLVLDAQTVALSHLKPGNTIQQAMDACVDVITNGLIELGLLSGSLQENLEQKSWRAFFMHGLGHWLGLDVHDVGHYKVNGEDRPLQPGMVLTVEPGLYVAPDADVEEKWRGIGIRIEDNIVITETGHTNMTAAAPKHIADIEALMSSGKTA